MRGDTLPDRWAGPKLPTQTTRLKENIRFQQFFTETDEKRQMNTETAELLADLETFAAEVAAELRALDDAGAAVRRIAHFQRDFVRLLSDLGLSAVEASTVSARIGDAIRAAYDGVTPAH